MHTCTQDAVFELVDTWSSQISADAYVYFLSDLHEQVRG